MNLRDLKLIALQQTLTLYKNKEIGACGGNIDISTIKKQLTQGTSFDDDELDININIENTIEEPDVTIVNQTVECDEHHAPPAELKETVEVTDSTVHPDENHVPPAEPNEPAEVTDNPVQSNETPYTEENLNSIINTENNNYGIKGKLFQYFKGGNNAEK